ncbi:MAG: translocation/assembly module TamB domain-containing protein [Rhodobacter sp.]|nr:translocation/assembly module TamB domain-containing protein [Rhodobacter sp.]
MRRFLAISALVLALLSGPGQAQTDDRGILQAFLEDNLSDAGRDVRIEGFEGALSGRATIDSLTIADKAGIWLTIRGAVLDWNRAGLLRGRLEIAELSAQTIAIARAPQPAAGLPPPEATPFALPDLPVSIEIGTLEVARLILGAPLLGEDATMSLDGSVTLSGGAGRASLSIGRLGATPGNLRFAGSFSNATRMLSLDLDLTEAKGGIAATLLGLPGRPPVGFRVAGSGPISNFIAEIGLATDGQTRLTGSVSLADLPDADDPQIPMQRFMADIGGDLRPLVEPQYRRFLGADIRLRAAGQRRADGRVEVDDLSLRSAAAALSGELVVAADGWPERIAVTGRIAPIEGTDVTLALPGPETRIGAAELSLSYDAATSDIWSLAATVDRLRRPDLALANVRIAGQGALSPDVQGAGGTLDVALSGLDPFDRDLANAIGPDITGGLSFDWRQGATLQLSNLEMAGRDYTLSGSAQIAGVDGQIDLSVSGDIALVAQDLSRFAGLLGQPLGGAAQVRIAGSATPVSGAFDLALTGYGQDLAVGQPRLDPLIGGPTRLSIDARRDRAGLRLEQLAVTSATAAISASGHVASDASDLTFALSLDETGQIIPGADGPLRVSGTARQSMANWRLDARASAPGAASATFTVGTTLVDGQAGPTNGEVTLQIEDLGPYADLAGRPIAGALSLEAAASGDLRDGTVTGALDGTARNLRTGIPEADLLLRGQTTFGSDLRREADGITVFDRFELRTPQIIADLTGSVGAAKSRVRYAIDLRDLGLFVDGLTGPVAAQGVASAAGGPWTIGSALQGPGGTSAAVDGQVARDGTSANLAISGTAPLALANRFVLPNLAEGTARFDLRLDGSPRLRSVSGAVRTDGARLTLPALGLGLSDIAAEGQISGGSMQVSATSAVSSGGRLRLGGRVGLGPPFTADLVVDLAALALRQAGLYETTADGRVAVSGALRGGAIVTGDIALGATEIRVPDGAGAPSGALPGLVHLNEPAPVRQTRLRAGLIDRQKGGAGAVYPLDLIVRAPSRIFVRGRGLDVELGGMLRLTGDTADVVTEGRFELIRGRLDILGRRLTLSEASVQLQGDLDPYIRAVADTDSAGTRIQVIVEGPASSPQVSFVSSPDLPEDEILARLLFGRDISEISPLQALQIANAVRVLAGRGGEGVVGRLRQSFGLDDLDVTSGEDGDAGVRLGKYINENVYTDVTVDTSGKSEINLNLTLSPSVTARGRLSSDGNSGIGLFFERDY